MSTRGAEAIASIAASMSERETLRAVSSTLTWSAASEVSNSLWSSENSGSATGAPVAGAACMRRYSSRAAPCSSGKPSKPSACEKRTTVELEVFARRASSSAVWKAASSRWSTMYCATSFCERENSSNRAWMYAERVWWALPAYGGGGGVAARFIGRGGSTGRLGLLLREARPGANRRAVLPTSPHEGPSQDGGTGDRPGGAPAARRRVASPAARRRAEAQGDRPRSHAWRAHPRASRGVSRRARGAEHRGDVPRRRARLRGRCAARGRGRRASVGALEGLAAGAGSHRDDR